MAPLLEVSDLTVDFPTDDGVVHAVRGVSYTLAPGEVLGIVGESGSGKSVTSLAIMGLLPRTARIRGSISFRGEDLLKLSEKQLVGIRGKKIAMIFQDPMTSLNPVYTVGWQLAEAVLAHHDVSKKDAMARAVDLLDLVGIPNPRERARSYPHEFSGGMRQRAVIAMAMANDPDVIIADEPTTALDVTVQAQVLETLEKALAETHSAMVLITHDLGVVAGRADKVLVMYAGKAVEIGPVDDIYEHPRMPYTLGLLGSLPRLDAEEGEKLTPIQGAPPSLINLPPGCPFSPRCPLSRPRCEEEEPALHEAGPGHVAACHFWRELSGDVAAEEIFEVTAADLSSLDVVAVVTGDGAAGGEVARGGGEHAPGPTGGERAAADSTVGDAAADQETPRPAAEPREERDAGDDQTGGVR
jgi:peptide/nickel transport system ATP-binding protein